MILLGAAGALIGLLLVLLGGLVWRLRAARAGQDRARARLAALLESDAAGLAVWDAGGRLVACNGRFREFYPEVTLKPGLEFEDLVRYTATRAVVIVPEEEIEGWIEERLDRRAEAMTETRRTPDDRWVEIRMRPTEQGETLLVYTDVTAVRAAATADADSAPSATAHAAALRMLQEAMTVGREAGSFHQAVRDVTRLLAESGGWDAGTAYLAPADAGGALVSSGVWHVANEQVAPLTTRAAIDACCDDPDDQVLRRAVFSAATTWIANVTVDPRLSDARRDALGHIRSICAVPIVSAGRVVAVLELFAATPTAPDSSRERLIVSTVGQLAHVVERERAAFAPEVVLDAGTQPS